MQILHSACRARFTWYNMGMDKLKEKRKHKALPSFEVYQHYLEQKLFLRQTFRNVLLALLSMVVVGIVFLGLVTLFESITPSDYEVFQSTYGECLLADNFTQEQCYDIAIAGSNHGD